MKRLEAAGLTRRIASPPIGTLLSLEAKPSLKNYSPLSRSLAQGETLVKNYPRRWSRTLAQ